MTERCVHLNLKRIINCEGVKLTVYYSFWFCILFFITNTIVLLIEIIVI